jgi:hypothetical protein
VSNTISPQRQRANPDLPACPDWCPGDCYGGQVHELTRTDGTIATIYTARLHERTLTEITAEHASLIGEPARVKVLIERCDEAGEPASAPRLVLDCHTDPIALSPMQARQLAAALLEAVALVDTDARTEGPADVCA